MSYCSFELYYFLNDNSFVDGYYVKMSAGGSINFAEKEKITVKNYIVLLVYKQEFFV